MPERAVLPSLVEPHDDSPTAAPVTDILPALTSEGSGAWPKLSREVYLNCQFQLAAALRFLTANVISRVLPMWEERPTTSVPLPTSSVLLVVGLGETGGAMLYLLYLLCFTSRRTGFGRLATNELLLLLAGGISGTSAVLHVFSSFLSIPAGDPRAVFLLTPVIFLFVAGLVLSEPLKKSGFLSATTAFTGLVFVPHPVFFIEDAEERYMSLHDRIVLILNMGCGSLAFMVVYLAMCTLIVPMHFVTDVLLLGVTTLILSVVMRGGFKTLSFILCERSIVICGAIIALFTFLGLLCLSYGGLNSGDRRKPTVLCIIWGLLILSLPNFILDERSITMPSMGSSVGMILVSLHQMKPQSYA